METGTEAETQTVKGLFSDFLTAASILYSSKKLNQLCTVDKELERKEGSLDAFFDLLNVVGYSLFRKPTNPPFVVVIEGLDGTGKTTLVKSLAKETYDIEGQQFNAHAVGTPTVSVSSVRDIFDKCGGQVSRAFYMVSNYILQHEMRIKSEKDPFAIFFVDRWYSSTCAYSIGWRNTSGGPESVDALDTSLFEWPKDLDVPNIMIVLHVDGMVRRRRIRQRGELLNHNPWDNRLTSDDNLGRRIVRAWERMSGPQKAYHLSANGSKEKVLKESQKVIRESIFRQFIPVKYFQQRPLGMFRWISSCLGHCNGESGLRYEYKAWNYQVCIYNTDNGNVSLQNHQIQMVDDDGILSFSTDHFEGWNMPGRNALASVAWVQGDYPKEYHWKADGIICLVTASEFILMDTTSTPGIQVCTHACIREQPKQNHSSVENEEMALSLHRERISRTKLGINAGKFPTRFVPLRMELRIGDVKSRGTSHSYEWVRDRKLLGNAWSFSGQRIPPQSSSDFLKQRTLLPVTLAILGTHTSGKKTLGERLAAIFGWSFHPELGDILRDRDNIIAAGHKTGDGRAEKESVGMVWDDKIHEAECERDRATTCSRVVETWHVGNVAWALLRQKSSAALMQNAEPLIDQAKDAIKSELKKAVVLFVHLGIDVGTSIRRRQTEENAKRIPMMNERDECTELHEALDVQGAKLLSEFTDFNIPVLHLENSEDGEQAIDKSIRQIIHFVNRNLWRKVFREG